MTATKHNQVICEISGVKGGESTPSAAPLTNHPCIQSKTPYFSPYMGWLIIAGDHNHTGKALCLLEKS